jgi:hypothetical protein
LSDFPWPEGINEREAMNARIAQLEDQVALARRTIESPKPKLRVVKALVNKRSITRGVVR